MTFFTLLQAIAIFLILEGLFPFISPSKWREYILNITEKDDKFIRNIGLLSIFLGVVFLGIVSYLGFDYNADILMD
tara:strand:- start:610 stop:837 length:228 start_codon:yes stop_codon:yes gene_type:complete